MSEYLNISKTWSGDIARRIANAITVRFHALTAIVMMIALLLIIGSIAIVSSSMRALIESLLHVIADTTANHKESRTAAISAQES